VFKGDITLLKGIVLSSGVVVGKVKRNGALLYWGEDAAVAMIKERGGGKRVINTKGRWMGDGGEGDQREHHRRRDSRKK